MSIVLPSGQVALYLQAIGACALYIAEPLRVDAATLPDLRRARRTRILWLCWTRSIEDAQQVLARPAEIPDIVRNKTALPEIITAIEQRAQELQIALTPHDKAIERADFLAQRVHEALDSFRRSGKLGMFNKA